MVFRRFSFTLSVFLLRTSTSWTGGWVSLRWSRAIWRGGFIARSVKNCFKFIIFALAKHCFLSALLQLLLFKSWRIPLFKKNYILELNLFGCDEFLIFWYLPQYIYLSLKAYVTMMYPDWLRPSSHSRFFFFPQLTGLFLSFIAVWHKCWHDSIPSQNGVSVLECKHKRNLFLNLS